ncbi:MAG: sensor domain-containing diguanylate cyclase [Conexibacter sp.]
MGFDRRLAREIAPFGAAASLGFAIVPIGNRVEWAGYGLAAAMTVAVACLALLVPWRQLPEAMRVVPSLLFLLAVALLRDASGGAVAGVGALALLPVFWLALHGTRGQLLILIAGVCAFLVTPALLAGGPEYPLSIWRIAVVFAAVSAIVGIAVQNLVARVRSHAEGLAVRERDLEAMADLLRSLSVTTDARERICAAACDLSGAHFAVLLEERSDGTLARTAGAGRDLLPLTFAPTSGPSWAMAAYCSRQAMFVSDPGQHPHGAIPGIESPAAVLFEPVHRGEDVVGVLVAGWREPPSDERRMRGLVRLLASEAAFVIERADLLERLTEFALTDVLTGLPNRRAWDRRLEQAICDAEPVCVAILDLDHFKSYNDEHGHQTGDRLLKEAAAAWRAELRPTDTLARYGGEEFVVLLHGHDLEVACRVVDRLRAATPRGQSCSAGVARREAGEASATLLGRADRALYDAKRAGRNRSLIAAAEAAGDAMLTDDRLAREAARPGPHS